MVVPIEIYNFIREKDIKAIIAEGGPQAALSALSDQRARFSAFAWRRVAMAGSLLAVGALARLNEARLGALYDKAAALAPDNAIGIAYVLALSLLLKAVPYLGLVAGAVIAIPTAVNALALVVHELSCKETISAASARPVVNYGGETREPRAVLIEELKAYADRYHDEADAVKRALALARGRSDCLSRSRRAGHVTGSAFVVDPAMERVLLVHHAKLDAWLQPGGHVEAGETALTAALRETLEETGVAAEPAEPGSVFDIDVHEIPARGEAKAHLHYDVRYLLTAEPGETTVSHESKAVEWVSLDEAARRNPSDSITRMIAKVRVAKVRVAKVRIAKVRVAKVRSGTPAAEGHDG